MLLPFLTPLDCVPCREKSLCLIGEEVDTPTDSVDNVDRLLDITMTSPSDMRSVSTYMTHVTLRYIYIDLSDDSYHSTLISMTLGK